MFSNPQIARVLRVEEVAHLLIVDLDVGYFHREINMGVGRLLLLDAREQL